MKILMPENVNYILKELKNHGFEAYAVGGCVRDSILNRIPDDWDITTSAKPEQIKEIFRKTIDTGIQHGTVTVMRDHVGYEVTTYRIDGEYEDSRHPKEVIFTGSLLEDLKRRDFTINAMAYNEEEGLIDAFGGLQDIEKGVVRCVGEAEKRFEEDALRMMRAVRFSAQLGYKIEEKTAAAIGKLAGNLKNISAERIQAELTKLLVSPHPDFLRDAYALGITAVVLPEFDVCMNTEQNNPHHKYNVGEHTLKTLLEIEPNKVLRLAMLFHDIGKPQKKTTDDKGIDHFYGHHEDSEVLARKILKRLRFDNDTLDRVTRLVKYHDLDIGLTSMKVKKAMVKVGIDNFPLLLEVKRADFLAQSDYKREEKLEKWQQVKEIYESILERGDCIRLKDMAVTGGDLIAAGMKPGKELGEVLQRLFLFVLEHPEKNEKEILLQYVKNSAEKK